MEPNLEKFIYIKDIELFTLLAGLGVSEWYGISSNIDLDNTQINHNEVLTSLYQKEYIHMKDETAKISKELSEILSVLIASKTYIYVRRFHSETPVMTFYLSENNAVYVERSVNEDNTLKLAKIEFDSLRSFLIKGCFEEDIIPIESEKIYPTEMISFKDKITEQIIYDNEFITVVEKHNTLDGSMLNRLIVQDLGVNYRLYIQSNSSELCVENTEKNQTDIIKVFIEK